MFWDKEYQNKQRVWGERPSELAIITVDFILKNKLTNRCLKILDIGCGYGRDTIHLRKNLDCSILGVDNSPKAIEIATNSIEPNLVNIHFRCSDFTELSQDKFDIVFAANLYQVLNNSSREELRKSIVNLLNPNGILFLNTLSINDPEEYGKGEPCADEPNSFINDKYLHFCTKEELEDDFKFITIKKLYEHEYDEPRNEEKDHHHISWIVIGEFAGGAS